MRPIISYKPQGFFFSAGEGLIYALSSTKDALVVSEIVGRKVENGVSPFLIKIKRNYAK